MNKIILLIFTILFSNLVVAKDDWNYKVMGNAHLLMQFKQSGVRNPSYPISEHETVKFVELSPKIIGIMLTIENGKTYKLAHYVDENADDPEYAGQYQFGLYEYDFNNDGKKELIIVGSQEYSMLEIYVFEKFSDQYQQIGHFNGQFEVTFDKKDIILPFGSKGLADVYRYMNGRMINIQDN